MPHRTAQHRVRLLLALALLAVAWPPLATAAEPPRARLNHEYREIDPQPVAPGPRIEVIEFFWYGCPFCFQLQPPLERWIARMPEDVALRRVPAIFRESWVPHARLYYTLQALGETGRLHQAVYRSYHLERENLNTPEGTAAWAARHGIDRDRWLTAYHSEEVTRGITASWAHTQQYAVRGTPSLVVDGRYLTSSGMSETVPGVIPILDDLVVLARERRAAR